LGHRFRTDYDPDLGGRMCFKCSKYRYKSMIHRCAWMRILVPSRSPTWHHFCVFSSEVVRKRSARKYIKRRLRKQSREVPKKSPIVGTRGCRPPFWDAFLGTFSVQTHTEINHVGFKSAWYLLYLRAKRLKHKIMFFEIFCQRPGSAVLVLSCSFWPLLGLS